MAVTVPTPPVPPTPPAVPTVTLGGGGSVTESTVPQSGHQSDADRQEAQARQAVARGDGALSKTTKEQPQQPAQQKQPANGTDESKTTVQTDPQAAAAMQADGDQKQQQYDQSTADKSVLLSSHRKNKVGLILRNKVSIIYGCNTGVITESTSHKLSGGDGCF